uniref:Tc1-like transposase DDE domain-containing protein n=1 Tax=Anopheles funestus TaxID=62324 RepID=A0A182S3P6_ANOFN
MMESLQQKQAKLILLLSTQGLKDVSNDDENEQKEDKPKNHIHPISTNNVQEIEIEPLRIITQDNVSDDGNVVYVKTDRIAVRTKHNTLSVEQQPSVNSFQPIKSSFNTSSVLQQRSVRKRNIQDAVVPKKPKLMPAYSKIKPKEKEPEKKKRKRKDPSSKSLSMKSYSDEDRKQIVAKYESGLEAKAISEMQNIPNNVVVHVLREYKKTSNATSFSSHQKEITLALDVLLSIQIWMKDDSNVSLAQLLEKVWTTYNLRTSTASIMRSLVGFNYFFNRVKTISKNKNVNSTLGQIKEYATNFANVPQNVSKLGIIFLDCITFNVTFKAGTHLKIQHKTFSIICAMNESGVLHYLTKNTHINKDNATEFVYDMKNTLRELNIEESVVVIGHAASQRYAKLQDAIGYYKCNAMFLPSNATYLNPVEYLFKNFRRIIRRTNPQTIEKLMQAVEAVPSLIRENDCKNWFELMWSYVPRCMEEEIIDDFDAQD